MQRLRILVAQDMDWMSSLPLASHHIFEFLSTKGHRVTVVDYQDDAGRPKAQIATKYARTFIRHRWRRNSQIQLVRIPRIGKGLIGRLTSFVLSWPFLAAEVRKTDVTVLYSVPTYGLQVVLISRLLRKPILFHSFDVLNKFVRQPELGFMVKLLEKFVYRECEAVVAITPSLANYVEELGARKNYVRIIPNGVDIRRFGASSEEPSPILRDHGLVGKRIILYTGWLYPFSGLDHVLQGIDSSLKAEDVYFVVAGEGELSQTIRAIASKAPRVVFLGRVPFEDVVGLIQGSTLCINPFQEDERSVRAFPNKVLEYMACGKPSLVTPLPGTLEVLGTDSGVLFSELDYFNRALVALINDPIRLSSLGMKARVTAQTRFNLESNSIALLEVIEDLCPKPTEVN